MSNWTSCLNPIDITHQAKKFAFGLICLAISVGESAAEDLSTLPNQTVSSINFEDIYVSFSGGAMVSELPSISYGHIGWAPTTTGDLFRHLPDVTTELFSGTFGFYLPWHTLASDLRVELQGTWWDGDKEASFATPAGTAATYVSVDGSRQILFGSGSPSAQFETQYRGFETAIRLKGEYELGGRAVLSPSLGVIGGKRRQLHDLDISTPFAGGTLENPIEVKETLHTRELGGEIGAELTFGVSERLSLVTKLHGAAIHSRSRLKATDCLGNAIAIRSACDGGFYATTVEDSDKKINYRLKGSIGTNVLLPLGQLSLTGFGGWDSDIAGVRNPTPENRAPASIKYDDSFHYGWQVKFSIPLH